MKTSQYFLVIIAAVFSTTVAKAQPCCCQKFPFYYCNEAASNPQATLQEWCTDDPYNNGAPSTGGVLGPTVVVKAPNIFSCIAIGSINSCGYVSGGVDSTTSSRPGVNVDSDNIDFNSIGSLFIPLYPGGPNQLEELWASPGGLIQSCIPSATFDSSCCIGVVFESDLSWWQQELGPSFDPATTALAVVIRQWNSSCQVSCSIGTNYIYINTCPGFFTNSSDPNYIPTELARGYANFVGRPAVPGGNIQVGVLDDSEYSVYMNYAWDFSSIIMHEMGHWLGLPDRNDTCENTGGEPCSTDNNSFMSPLKNGVQRWNGDSEDCCWLNKLYNPSSVPKCNEALQTCLPLSSVGENIDVGELNLIPAYPNPTTGETTLGFTNDRTINYTFVIYDVLGRIVYTIESNQVAAPGNHVFTIPSDALPSGNYIYSLKAGGVALSKTLSVTK